MRTKNCNIVIDLLPNYLEGLTSSETNNFIREHLSECDECNKKYLSMKENIEIKKNEKEEKQISGLKKIYKKFNILKLSIILILAISLGIMTYYYFYMRNAYSGTINELVEVMKALEKHNLTIEFDNTHQHIIDIVENTQVDLD